MKIYRTIFVTLILIGSLLMTTASAENIFTITDDLKDVTSGDEYNVSYPDADIKKLTINKNNDEIELILELNNEGRIISSASELPYYYTVYIMIGTTSDNIYEITYGSDLVTLTNLEAQVAPNGDMDQNLLKDYSVNKNKLTLKFDLLESYERIIYIENAFIMLVVDANNGYVDNLNQEAYIPSIDAGGPYNVKAGDKVTLNGTIDVGDPENYTWYWIIDDTSIVKEGKTTQHTFLIPGDYTGNLYVVNSQALYNYDSFQVNVNGTAQNNDDNNNNEPGFEMLLVFAAIAIALIILKKRK